MTTKFLDNKICSFKILLSWRFPRKNSVLDDFPLCPQGPPPSKSENFIFIVVSPSLIFGSAFRQTPQASIPPLNRHLYVTSKIWLRSAFRPASPRNLLCKGCFYLRTVLLVIATRHFSGITTVRGMEATTVCPWNVQDKLNLSKLMCYWNFVSKVAQRSRSYFGRIRQKAMWTGTQAHRMEICQWLQGTSWPEQFLNPMLPFTTAIWRLIKS